MGLYADWILPHLISLAMRNRDLVPYRQRIISAAEGRVLEIGIGSGLNLPYYGPQVREIIGLDPSPRLLAMARRAAEEAAIPVAFTEGTAEEISLDDRSVDTAVTTWTLCSIPQGCGPFVKCAVFSSLAASFSSSSMVCRRRKMSANGKTG